MYTLFRLDTHTREYYAFYALSRQDNFPRTSPLSSIDERNVITVIISAGRLMIAAAAAVTFQEYTAPRRSGVCILFRYNVRPGRKKKNHKKKPTRKQVNAAPGRRIRKGVRTRDWRWRTGEVRKLSLMTSSYARRTS